MSLLLRDESGIPVQHKVVEPGLSTSRPSFINRLHNFFGPPHRVRDCVNCRRNSFPAIKLSEFAGSEDTCRDQQHALAGLVHTGNLPISLFVRYTVKMSRHRCEITGVKF